MTALRLVLGALLLTACEAPRPAAAPEETGEVARAVRVDASTFVDKVTAGYQAWFSCPTDGAQGWSHWAPQTPAPNRITFELYPDVREYDPLALCATQLGPLGNGQSARLYNASSRSVIDTHFRWMQEYGIDGVGMQRFVVGLYGDKTHGKLITRRVRDAAEQYGRIFYVMYDISGAHENDWDETIKRDWVDVMENELGVVRSPQYARQGGRAVVNLWGIGSGDRPGTATQALDLINWFKARGVYVVGGVPYWWRDPNGTKPGFEAAYAALDMVQPWSVGTFASETDADAHFGGHVADDLALTRSRGQAYQRVLWPGFAWSNWNGGGRNGIPRRAGSFFWRQAWLTARSQSSAYIAMFDEYDEGTAIAKAAEDVSMIPRDQYFLTLDADGPRLSSDFYLRLAGAATQMLQGRAPLSATVPVPAMPPPPPVGSVPLPPPADAARLTRDQRLDPGQRLTTRDGRFTLNYQSDGNLVLYGASGALWASGTTGAPGRTVMQSDGNLVVYSAAGVPVWASGTQRPGAFLALLSDGNLVVYRGDGLEVLWQRTGASPPAPPPPGPAVSRLTAGQVLHADERLTSPDGRHVLTYQSDGNLVRYAPQGPTWASNTFDLPGNVTLQSDGNLVMHDRTGRPVWHTSTHGNPGAALELAGDGSLVVRSAAGAVLWSAP